MLQLKLKMTGKSALLLSCDRMADPTDELTIKHKELTLKRTKTMQDHIDIAKSQWRGLLYWDDELGVYMPTQNIRAALIRGGTLNKLGMDLKRGTLMPDGKTPIDYGKKLTIAQLWEQNYIDRRSVVVSRARVMAFRPKFINWSITFDLMYDEYTLDENKIMQSFKNAGDYVGIGGYRPEKGGSFGRFDINKVA